MNYKSIIISDFNKDVPPILGVLGEGGVSTTPLTDICTPELWNDHDGVSVLYLQEYNYIEGEILKFNAGINIELGRHMEAWLLASKFLRKCGVFWYQLATEIEAFRLHLVTTTYGEGCVETGKV